MKNEENNSANTSVKREISIVRNTLIRKIL